MSQPTEYVRVFNFTQHSADYPTTPQPGVSLDAEFNAIKETTDEVRTNLALIQNDSGSLKNASVGVDQLTDAMKAYLGIEASEDPAYAPFYSPTGLIVPATPGIYLVTSTTLGLAANGVLQIQAGGVVIDDTGDYSYLQIAASNADDPVTITVKSIQHVDVGLTILAKGDGPIIIRTADSTLDLRSDLMVRFLGENGAVQFQVRSLGDGTNYLEAKGGDTGVSPVLIFQGEATVGGKICVAGTGNIDFYTSVQTNRLLSLVRVASAVNYLRISPSIAGVAAQLDVQGSDSAIGIRYNTKGNSGVAHTFYCGNAAQVQLGGTNTSTSYLNLSGGPDNVLISAQAGTNPSLTIYTVGTGEINFYTNNLGSKILSLVHAASAVNRVTITPAATGVGPAIAAAGETDIDLKILPAGTGLLRLGGGSVVANGSVATTMTSLGPTGASTTIRKWVAFKDNSSGTTYYLPAY